MLPSIQESIIKTVEKVSPSVVNVSTVRIVHDAFFHAIPLKGVGSGFIFDSKGYILTNYHVVEDAEKVQVSLIDGKLLAGKIIGVDPSMDIAIIKVSNGDLKEVELGDSNSLKVGQFVIAIGNPFGLIGGPSVTFGVISSLNRRIKTKQGIIENLIQTDAAVNPGNSGGPLIDLNGKVIGITTAIIPFAQGIGFAIPINSIKQVLNDLINYGKVIRPWLGIVGITMNKGLADYFNLLVDKGVLIAKVIEGSPAYKHNLRVGDIIQSIDGNGINNLEDLLRELQKRKPGNKIDVSIVRGNKKGVIKVTLGSTP
ncbi:MAG: trypsin-like peptidase domain-containing protein [Candidatus Bathyarchaeia archaeon]